MQERLAEEVGDATRSGTCLGGLIDWPSSSDECSRYEESLLHVYKAMIGTVTP